MRYLFFLLPLMIFAGCRGGNDNIVRLNFWAIGLEGEKVVALIPQFEKENPGIKITVQQIPWTAAHEKLITAYASGTLPDVFQIGNTWVPEFKALSTIENLDVRVSRSQVIKKEKYFPGIWDTNVMDSSVYGIPWYVDTRVLFYRTDLLQKAGVNEFPKTWDEFYTACQKIRNLNRKNYAFFLPTNEWAPFAIFGMQKGSGFFKNNNQYGDFSGAKFEEAMNYCSKLYNEGLALYDMQKVLNVYQAFAEGYFAFYITGPWNVSEFRNRLPQELQDKWMTAPLPSFDGSYPGVSSAGGASLVINAKSENKEAAWKWIEYLSTERNQLKFYNIVSSLPAKTEAWKDPVFSGNKYMQAFYTQLLNTKPNPQIAEWEQIVFEKLQTAVEFFARGDMSVDASMKKLDREVNNILEKRRWLIANGRMK